MAGSECTCLLQEGCNRLMMNITIAVGSTAKLNLKEASRKSACGFIVAAERR